MAANSEGWWTGMRTLSYQSSTTGESIGFDGPLYGETMPALRGHAWTYKIGTRALTGLSMPAHEETITVKALDAQADLDRLRALADADLAQRSPGMLVVDGEWRCPAYIVKSEVQSVEPQVVTATLTIVMLDVWRRELPTVSYYPAGRVQSSPGLDFPFDLPVDLMPMAQASTVDNPGLTPMAFRMTIFGPALNPHVTIAGNNYQVNLTVPDGGYLKVDSVERTVTLTDANGGKANGFAAALRGTGRDGGEYIFQPLPPGESAVSWANGFGFDLTRIEERSEPPWST